MIIAGAGGAAHLPGMVAALTPLPVIGVPVRPAGAHLDGLDALLSIVQVPFTSLCWLRPYAALTSLRGLQGPPAGLLHLKLLAAHSSHI